MISPRTTFFQLRVVLVALLLVSSGVWAQAQPLKREVHTPEEQYRFAEGLFVRKFYDLAEKEFRYFLDKHLDHELAPLAMFQLIQCLRFQDKQEATLSAINNFQARWPKHDLAAKLFLWKGEYLMSQGRLDVAAGCFKRLILNPDTVTQEAALYFLAECYAKSGKPELAIKTYRKIAANPIDDKHPYRPYALFAVAASHQQKGEFEAAAAAFARLKDSKDVPARLREEAIYRFGENVFARGKFKEALVLYETLIVDYPNGAFSREARKRRVWALFSLQDFAKAVELAKEWRTRYGDVFDYELDYVHGASLVGIGLYADALPLFRKLTSEPRVPDEYSRLVRFQEVYCLLRLDRFDETVAKAAEFNKDYPKVADGADIHFFAGEALFQQAKYADAATQLRRALDTFVGDWSYFSDANYRLADCLDKQGKFKEEAAVYRRLADSKKAKNQARALLQAGICERKAKDWKAAAADLEGLLKRFPKAAEEARAAMVHLGELYAHLEQYDRAEGLMKDLLARGEQDGKARVLFFLGYLNYQQEKYAAAETSLRQALTAKGSESVINNAKYYLAASLLEQEKDDEALGLFAQLLSLEPANRPSFDVDLLLRLEKLFYDRNQYDVSETICRWLLTRDDGDTVYKASLRLSRLLIAQNRLPDARKFLEELLGEAEAAAETKAPAYRKEEILSLYGEVLLLLGDNDRAVGAFEQALTCRDLAAEYAARARWGLADVLKREGRLNQALHYAVNAFVLGDDPVYTPRAMFVAIEILSKQEKMTEAATTWGELKSRYPSFAQERRETPLVLGLPKAGGAEGGDETKGAGAQP